MPPLTSPIPALSQAMPQHHAVAPDASAGAGPVLLTSAATAPDPTPPPVAKPVLASTLLANLLRQHEGHRRYRDGHVMEKGDGTGAEKADRVRSGFGELDDYVLMGGAERGAVVGVSGNADGGDGGGVGRLVS
jgi:hypothetical protein